MIKRDATRCEMNLSGRHVREANHGSFFLFLEDLKFLLAITECQSCWISGEAVGEIFCSAMAALAR